MPDATVRTFLTRHSARGDLTLRHYDCDKKSVLRGEVPFTDSFAHDRELLLPATLKNWAGLSLPKRAAKIELLYGVHRYPDTLSLWYKANGVRMRRTYMCFRGEEVDREQIEKDRAAFALKLRKAIVDGRTIIYADESTYHGWVRQAKAWYFADTKFRVPLSSKRGHGQTLFGAVSTAHDRLVYSIGSSTNIDEFKEFIRQLAATLPPRDHYARKPWLVLDSKNLFTLQGSDNPVLVLVFCADHSTHHNGSVLRLARQHFQVQFQPRYSSQFK